MDEVWYFIHELSWKLKLSALWTKYVAYLTMSYAHGDFSRFKRRISYNKSLTNDFYL